MPEPVSPEYAVPNQEVTKPKTKTYVASRFTNASPTQLRDTLYVNNEFQSSHPGGSDVPPGLFFVASSAKNPEELEIAAEDRRLANPDWKVKYIDMGGGVGKDVYYDSKEAKFYLTHSPYAARILIHITPDNFHVFQGRIHLSDRVDMRERRYTPVDSFDSLQDNEVTINLKDLSPEQLKALGENVKVAIFSKDNLDPNYLSYSEFLDQNNDRKAGS